MATVLVVMLQQAEIRPQPPSTLPVDIRKKRAVLGILSPLLAFCSCYQWNSLKLFYILDTFFAPCHFSICLKQSFTQKMQAVAWSVGTLRHYMVQNPKGDHKWETSAMKTWKLTLLLDPSVTVQQTMLLLDPLSSTSLKFWAFLDYWILWLLGLYRLWIRICNSVFSNTLHDWCAVFGGAGGFLVILKWG